MSLEVRVEPLCLLGLVGRRGRFADALAQRVEVGRDLVFDRLRVLRSAGHRLLRVLDLLLDHFVADHSGGVLQLARGVAVVGRLRVAGHAAELLLDLADLAAHLVLGLRQLLHALLALGARAVESGDLARDVALLLGQFVGLALQVLHVLARLLRLRVLQQPLRLLDVLQRALRLRAVVVVAVGRRLPRGVRAVLQASRRVREILPLLALLLGLAPQLFELPRRLVHLIGQRSLRGAAARSALLLARAPLRSACCNCRLASSCRRFATSSICCAALCCCALCDVSYWFAWRSSCSWNRSARSCAIWPPPPAATATALLLLAHFELVGLLGVLQVLQRALLGRQRFLRLSGP